MKKYIPTLHYSSMNFFTTPRNFLKEFDPLRRLRTIPELDGLTHTEIETKELMERIYFHPQQSPLFLYSAYHQKIEPPVLKLKTISQFLCQRSITADQITRFNGSCQHSAAGNKLYRQAAHLGHKDKYTGACY
jgi:hypothetical protein